MDQVISKREDYLEDMQNWFTQFIIYDLFLSLHCNFRLIYSLSFQHGFHILQLWVTANAARSVGPLSITHRARELGNSQFTFLHNLTSFFPIVYKIFGDQLFESAMYETCTNQSSIFFFKNFHASWDSLFSLFLSY